MRIWRLSGVIAASSLALIAAPCLAQSDQPPADGGQIETPHQAGTRNVVTAAEAPLHDVNLVRQKIPPILLSAMADPYARPRPLNCRTLANGVYDLSVALGADLDQPPPPEDNSVTKSGGVGLSLAHGAAANLLPFHSFIATLSGAEKHDALVLRAITAGSVRRAYMKGLGEAYRCPIPATPRHLAYAPPPVQDGPRKPMYPVR